VASTEEMRARAQRLDQIASCVDKGRAALARANDMYNKSWKRILLASTHVIQVRLRASGSGTIRPESIGTKFQRAVEQDEQKHASQRMIRIRMGVPNRQQLKARVKAHGQTEKQTWD
jgi:hypothetical protein